MKWRYSALTDAREKDGVNSWKSKGLWPYRVVLVYNHWKQETNQLLRVQKWVNALPQFPTRTQGDAGSRKGD